MDSTEARRRLDALISRAGGPGPLLVGVLMVDENGDLAVSMRAEDDVDLLRIGVLGRRKAGPVTADRDLVDVTPTLETPR